MHFGKRRLKSYLVSSLDYSFGKLGILEFCGKSRLTFGVRRASVLRQRSGLTPIMPSGRRRRQGSPDREGDADSSPLNHLIMQLVESQHDQMTQLLTTLAGRTAPRPTLTKLDVNDDVEAYLTTYERQMRAFDITEDQWSLYLAPQLTGRAQQAYAALHGDEAADYETVKTAILRRFAINSDTYRQRLRAAKLGKDEMANELRTRLLHYTTLFVD